MEDTIRQEIKAGGYLAQFSEKAFLSILELTPEWLEWLDQNGNFKFISNAVLTITGYHPKEFIEKPDLLFQIVHPDDLKLFTSKRHQILSREKNEIEFNFRISNLSGDVCHISHKGYAIYDSESWSGYFGINQDVTEDYVKGESLRKSQRTIEAVASSPMDVIVLLDPNGVVLFANQTLANRLNRPLDQILGLKIDEILPRRLANARMKQVKRVVETGQAVRFEDQGVSAFMDNTVYPVLDDDGQVVQVAAISRDITEIKKIETKLQVVRDELERKVHERTARLNRLNRELTDRITEHQQQIIHSETLARVAARMTAQIDQQKILEIILEETVNTVNYPISSIFLYNEEKDVLELAAFFPHFELQAPYPPLPRTIFEKYLRAYGPVIVIPDVFELKDFPNVDILREYHIRTQISIPMLNNGDLFGSLHVASIEDVRLPTTSELLFLKALAEQAKVGLSKAYLFKQLSETSKRLQSLSDRLVEIQEQERRKLAQELHDEIGQTLTSLRINLDLVNRSLSDESASRSDVRDNLERASATTSLLLEKVREISLDLRPAMLDDLGLIPALLAQFEHFSKLTGIQVKFKHSGVDHRFENKLETAVFRIIQEGLTNVARHAHCQVVSVRLWSDSNYLRLQVEDQGVGFNPQAALESQHASGLSGMQKRVSDCGGELEIETEIGRGTRIIVDFPLASGG
jgi:PAS domain S-box-containing protein